MSWVESHPSSSFSFSVKKELFRLVVLPCLFTIGLRVRVFMCVKRSLQVAVEAITQDSSTDKLLYLTRKSPTIMGVYIYIYIITCIYVISVRPQQHVFNVCSE